ncbi:unnamed protein product [Closterium sp. NIES-65]|nr:unnamed protein product [Closterium sp. NIES-65]CAI6006295.1 unnamed protein product [Closterium sp. NIES-65]
MASRPPVSRNRLTLTSVARVAFLIALTLNPLSVHAAAGADLKTLTADAGDLEARNARSGGWQRKQLLDPDRDVAALSLPLRSVATKASNAAERGSDASALDDTSSVFHSDSRSDPRGSGKSGISNGGRGGISSGGRPQWPNRPHVFDLADFGGVGDGATDNTRALQNAVYAVSGVADKGGGQLYVPPGVYVTGSVNLTSAMTLFLARGATIRGNPDPALWPVIPALPSYGRGREMPGPRYSSLLHCHNLTDVVITGDHGVIDGGGAEWWERKRGGVLQHSRGAVVEALWSSAVTVANVTLANAPAWALHPVYCTSVPLSLLPALFCPCDLVLLYPCDGLSFTWLCHHVQVSNVTITAPPDSPNTIGIVIGNSPILCSHHLSFASIHHECGLLFLPIKSGWDEYGLAFARPSHSITIQHSHIQTPLAAALSIGSEMSGGVHSLRCRHLSVSHSLTAFHLRTAPGRGGYIRDVLVQDVTMVNVTVALAFLPTCSSHPDDHFDPSALPRVANISFASISGSGISQAGSLIGLPAAPFRGVSLSDINLQLVDGGKGFKCQDVEGHARNVSPAICPELSALKADPLKCRGCSSVRELH